jgi:GH18 family chitinase
MKLKKAIKILKYYNNWRTGKVEEIKYMPREITEAIDKVLKEAKEILNK